MPPRLTFKPLRFLGLCLVALPCVAQPFDFPSGAVEDPAALSRAMPGLAREVIAVYREADRRQYLDNLFRLQIVAGQYAEANESLRPLRALEAGSVSPQAGAADVLYEVFAKAKAEDGSSFDEVLQRSFREAFSRLDDRTAAAALRALGADPSSIQQALNEALEPQKGKSTISLADALTLIRAYQVERAFRSLTPLAASQAAEDQVVR